MLDEIAYRDSGEDLQNNRAEELARWHEADEAAENTAADHDSYADERY